MKENEVTKSGIEVDVWTKEYIKRLNNAINILGSLNEHTDAKYLKEIKDKLLEDSTKPKIEKNNIKSGIELIADERQRQIEVEGYSAQHDSQHDASEFVYAAISYVESAKVGVNCMEMGNNNENEIMQRKIEMGKHYPFGWDFKPSTDIRDLVKAGALIAAAIDRLQMK